MGFYMESNGYYYIKVSQNGQITKFSTKTKSKELAQEIYNNFLKSLLEKESVARLNRKRNIVETTIRRKRNIKQQTPTNDQTEANNTNANDLIKAYDNYIATCSAKGHSAQNIVHKHWVMKKFNENKILSFSSLTQENLNHIFLRNKEYAGATANTVIKEIKAFLNNCIKRGLYNREDYLKLDFPNKEKDVSRDTTVNDEDFKKIIDYLLEKDEKDFAMYILTLYYTVSRPQEATIIKATDINFKDKLVLYQQLCNLSIQPL